jgi:hypothetical protein
MQLKSFSPNVFSHRDTLVGFTATEYSKFKYGSKAMARKFGTELAKHFCNSELEEIIELGKQVVVFPAPYSFIPTPSFAMKDYFITRLNEELVDRGMNPAQEGKIHRTPSYVQDYGLMSPEERTQAISGDDFYTDKEFLKGKVALFLDDIRITGAHERRMIQMIKHMELEPVCDFKFIYFAKFYPNPLKPEKEDIEHYFNLCGINDLMDIHKIVQSSEGFLFNTRNIKYILSATHDRFNHFIEWQTESFQRTLYHYSLGNGYHKHHEFETNFDYLKHLLHGSNIESQSRETRREKELSPRP